MLEYKRFPKEEYENRWERAKKLMKDKGFDALLITDGVNYTYLSGAHKDFSYSRPTIMILPKEGNPTIIIHEFFEGAQKKETCVKDIRIYRSLLGVPIELIKEVMDEKGLAKGVIGAELGYEQRLGISYNDFEKLKKEIPNAKFLDASGIIWELRMVKSKSEIERIRKACEITSKAYKKCFETIKEGMSEIEVMKILFDFMFKEGGSSPWCIMNSGPYNYDVVSWGPANFKLKKGNLLWIDAGCIYNDYGSDFSRMASIGEPSEKQKKAYQIVCRITKTCIEAIKPGVKASDVAKLCNKEFQKEGLEITFRAGRIGHGMGMMLTEPPHIAVYDETVLKPGMVITIEPGIVADYGCFHVEENVLVTEDGYEILSIAERELKVIK
ncbi:MAG: Xaa-Pro peptidase family protein [Candidatus Bathyarchaeia archaeon]